MAETKFKNPWKTKSTKNVFQNKYYTIREDQVIRPDGSEGVYFVIERPTAVFIVAVDEEGKFPLVGLFRYPTKMYSLEVPGGGSEGGDLLEAAKRELKEESGIIANEWIDLGTQQILNGLTDEMMQVFLARDLEKTDEHEQIEEGIFEIRWVTFQEAFDMIKGSEISDCQTISAITRAAIHLGRIHWVVS